MTTDQVMTQDELDKARKQKGKRARLKGKTTNESYEIVRVTPCFMILNMRGKDFKITHAKFKELWTMKV